MFRRVILLSGTAALIAAAPATAQQVYSPTSTSGSIETVTVTASPIAHGIDETASIAASLNRDEILQTGGGTLADALAGVPGVTGSSFAAGASRPVIRGMDASRVKLVENGLSSSDVSDVGPDHGVPFDPLSAQTIEVVRGAATLRYGSQAIGGVVNAINNRVPRLMPTADYSGEVNAGYGSAADSTDASGMADFAAGPFAFHADGFLRHAGNYDTPLGTQANSFFHAKGYSLGSSYFFGDNSRTGASVTQYDARYGIPAEEASITMHQLKAVTGSSFDMGTGLLQTINLDTSYADYTHSELEPDGTVGATFKNIEWDGRAEALLGAIGPLSASAVGVEIQNRKFAALGDAQSYLFPTLTQTGAVYVFTEAPIGSNLKVQASGRVETVHIEGTPASDVFTKRDFTPASGALGVLYEATGWLKLGLTASTAARAPAQTEMFSRGPHDGPGTFETGDPGLKLERANSLEGTARVRLADFTLDLSLWSSWFNNFIYGQLTGRTCGEDGDCAMDPSGDFRELLYLQQGASFRGLEAKGSYDLWKSGPDRLSLDVQGDYVRAKLSDGNNVPRIPPYRIGGGLTWASQAWDAHFLVLYNGRQNDFGLFDTPTPDFVELHASVAWRPLPAQPDFEVALIGHNLANTEQRNAASFNKDVVVLPGRDIRLVLRAAI
jgi:iron complex outermembrane recepter protein